MLDKITKEKIIRSYINEAKEFKCNHQHYVEACGLYCPVTHSWSIDMSGKLNAKCNTNCPHYSQVGSQIRAQHVLELIDTVKIDTINTILAYIENNPNVTSEDVIKMLTEEREKTYVQEVY
jgi:hypothetical protein